MKIAVMQNVCELCLRRSDGEGFGQKVNDFQFLYEDKALFERYVTFNFCMGERQDLIQKVGGLHSPYE